MAILDLFTFLVVDMTGSIIMATFLIILGFFVYGGFMNMNKILVTTISLMYTMAILSAYYGDAIAILMFLMTSIYFVTALIPWFVGMMNR